VCIAIAPWDAGAAKHCIMRIIRVVAGVPSRRTDRGLGGSGGEEGASAPTAGDSDGAKAVSETQRRR